MLSLFRINDLPRVIILAVVLAGIRIPFWISGIPEMETTFQFRILAEALSADRLIYNDVWHFTAPLSALFIQGIGELFGRSFRAFQIIGFILLFLQALYFNNILNRLDALKDRTLIPALFYVFFGSLFIEQYAFGPGLLAGFPLLFTLDVILAQIRFGAEDRRFFTIGFIHALAVLCYGSLFWFLPFFLFYFPFVFVMNARRYALLLTGFFFPILTIIMYFYMRGAVSSFSYQYLLQIFMPYDTNYLELQQYILILAIPVLILVIALFQTVFRSKFLNYQQSFIYFFLILFLISFLPCYFSLELSVRSFFVFIPAMAFFAAHLYLLLKRKGINELIFTALLALTVFVNYGFAYKAFFNPNVVTLNELFLTVQNEQKGMSITVVGNDPGYWYDNTFAGPFLYPNYTNEFFEGPLDHNKVNRIHDLMLKEAPEYIYDPHGYLRPYMADNFMLSQNYIFRRGSFQKKD